MTSRPILCLDFDGVIHSYTSGWQGASVVSDPPVEGAIEFIIKASDHFTVVVHSSRSGQTGGVVAMMEWLENHAIDYGLTDGEWDKIRAIGWPTEKPAAFLTIDDRALTFTGAWPEIETLKSFKPWNKK